MLSTLNKRIFRPLAGGLLLIPTALITAVVIPLGMLFLLTAGPIVIGITLIVVILRNRRQRQRAASGH